MPDTHESSRNLTEALLHLAEMQNQKGQQDTENTYRSQQMTQQGREADENRKARAQMMAEQINARKQAAFLPFFDKAMTEEQRQHPKENYQDALHNVMLQMKPEYRGMSPYEFDKNYKQGGATQPGAENQGGGFDVYKSLTAPFAANDSSTSTVLGFPFQEGKSYTRPQIESLEHQTNEEAQLTPYALARAKAMKDKLGLPGMDGAVSGSGSNLGF
jgi:hypothetical protein